MLAGMAEDLEFTEEEMFAHLEGGVDDGRTGTDRSHLPGQSNSQRLSIYFHEYHR